MFKSKVKKSAVSHLTPEEKAKREAAKCESREAQRKHEEALMKQEEERIDEQRRLAALRKLGHSIGRG